MPHTKKNFLIKCVFSLAAVSYDKIKKPPYLSRKFYFSGCGPKDYKKKNRGLAVY